MSLLAMKLLVPLFGSTDHCLPDSRGDAFITG
jgi:hypothetical protein